MNRSFQFDGRVRPTLGEPVRLAPRAKLLLNMLFGQKENMPLTVPGAVTDVSVAGVYVGAVCESVEGGGREG